MKKSLGKGVREMSFVDIPDSLCQVLSVTYLLFSLPSHPKKIVIFN